MQASEPRKTNHSCMVGLYAVKSFHGKFGTENPCSTASILLIAIADTPAMNLKTYKFDPATPMAERIGPAPKFGSPEMRSAMEAVMGQGDETA